MRTPRGLDPHRMDARTWTLAAGPSTGTQAVTVTVQWTARITHTVSVQTIVAQ